MTDVPRYFSEVYWLPAREYTCAFGRIVEEQYEAGYGLHSWQAVGATAEGFKVLALFERLPQDTAWWQRGMERDA
jgi:hypothetical protein